MCDPRVDSVAATTTATQLIDTTREPSSLDVADGSSTRLTLPEVLEDHAITQSNVAEVEFSSPHSDVRRKPDVNCTAESAEHHDECPTLRLDESLQQVNDFEFHVVWCFIRNNHFDLLLYF